MTAKQSQRARGADDSEERDLFVAGINPNVGGASPAGSLRKRPDDSYRRPQRDRRPFGYLREHGRARRLTG